jgi:hypothetical protein
VKLTTIAYSDGVVNIVVVSFHLSFLTNVKIKIGCLKEGRGEEGRRREGEERVEKEKMREKDEKFQRDLQIKRRKSKMGI